jgi:hypothetical protein
LHDVTITTFGNTFILVGVDSTRIDHCHKGEVADGQLGAVARSGYASECGIVEALLAATKSIALGGRWIVALQAS